MAIVFRSQRRSKYGNRKVRADGYVFASQREADRYFQLRLMEKAGQIGGLVVHPAFEICVNGSRVCRYVSDFSYYILDRKADRTEISGPVVEDAKGFRTRDYILKKQLMNAIYGITIIEV